MTERPVLFTKVFADEGDFAATYAAVKWLQARGFSVGHMQAGSPRGILRGNYDIQKWRNLGPEHRALLNGVLHGEDRKGPMQVDLYIEFDERRRTRWKPPEEKVRPGSAAISFDTEVLDEVRAEAERQGRSLSWMLQRAWKVARAQMKAIPAPPEVK